MGSFIKNIRFLRLNVLGVTQSEIADQLGFSLQKWNNYERGVSQPKFEDLQKISKYFEVLESDLWDGELNKSNIDEVKNRFLLSQNMLIAPPITANLDTKAAQKKPISPPATNTKSTTNATPRVTPNHKNAPISTIGHHSNMQEKDPDYQPKMPLVITVNPDNSENIVYVPVKAQAGYLIGHGDVEFIQSLPTFSMPGLRNNSYRMFEVEGVSMAPTLTHSDRVIGEWVPSVAEMRENRVHIIVLKDGVLIKRALNRIDSRGKIYLKSDTLIHRAEYPMREVDPAEIIEIWYVRMRISTNLSEPSELYHRIADLEINQHEILRKMGLDKV